MPLHRLLGASRQGCGPGTVMDQQFVCGVSFNNNTDVLPNYYEDDNRSGGYSVRLVTEVK